MQIENLINHPQLIPLLATWHKRQWQFSGENREALFHSRLGLTIPATFVALKNGKPIGFVSLLMSNASLPYSPWLASLFVHSGHRKSGVGKSLIEHCILHAKTLGYSALYLFTFNNCDFYRRLGWVEGETVRIFGKDETVFKYTICA